jgi:hypothetical protein
MEEATKELKDKKATGDDDVPGDVLKLLGEDGIRLMTQMIKPYKMQQPSHNQLHHTYSKDSSEDT